ncbi:MAG TPA: chemotaxis protein CheD [Gemmatimonadaceae bacterium]|nr:chemotaxis protein CheD [Gemmatimonadaceae bacterium]
MPDVTVGMADLRVSADPLDRLVTYALGSCLGIAVYDPVARVGGLLHVMLPLSSVDAERARVNPALCVDTGVPELFRACYRLGAKKPRMTVKVAGGAAGTAPGQPDQFQIGKRNVLTLRKLLWKNGVLADAMDVGGHQLSRTMSLALADGTVLLKVAGVTRPL